MGEEHSSISHRFKVLSQERRAKLLNRLQYSRQTLHYSAKANNWIVPGKKSETSTTKTHFMMSHLPGQSRSAPGITRRRRRSSFQLCFAVALLCYETEVVELLSYAKLRKLLNIDQHCIYFLIFSSELILKLNQTNEMAKHYHICSTFIQQAFNYFFWFWFIYLTEKKIIFPFCVKLYNRNLLERERGRCLLTCSTTCWPVRKFQTKLYLHTFMANQS